MIQNFKVDQTRTPKWVAQLAAEFRAFGRPQRELINVGVTSEKDPGEGLLPGTPVELLDFEIGVMERKNRENQVTGVQIWYRAGAIRSTAAVGQAPKPRATEGAA